MEGDGDIFEGGWLFDSNSIATQQFEDGEKGGDDDFARHAELIAESGERRVATFAQASHDVVHLRQERYSLARDRAFLRPMQYKTTPLFLESFGLNSLEDLPDLEVEIERPRELALPLIAGDAEPTLEQSAAESVEESEAEQ